MSFLGLEKRKLRLRSFRGFAAFSKEYLHVLELNIGHR